MVMGGVISLVSCMNKFQYYTVKGMALGNRSHFAGNEPIFQLIKIVYFGIHNNTGYIKEC